MSSPETTDDLVPVRDMGRSHKNNLRWRCYYAVFETKHRRQSDGHEFDSNLMMAVDAVLSVVKTELESFVSDR